MHRDLKTSYSASRQEHTQILKCYILSGCVYFGVLGAQEVLRGVKVRELVYCIFYDNQALD